MIAFISKRKPETVIHVILLGRFVEKKEFTNVIDVLSDHVAQCDNENNDKFDLVTVGKQAKNDLMPKKLAHLN